MPKIEIDTTANDEDFEDISTFEAIKLWVKDTASRLIWPILGISAAVAIVVGVILWVKHKGADEE